MIVVDEKLGSDEGLMYEGAPSSGFGFNSSTNSQHVRLEDIAAQKQVRSQTYFMYKIVEPQNMKVTLSDHIITPQADLVAMKIEKSRELSNKCLLYALVLDQLENK